MSPEVDTPVPAVTSTCSTSGTGSTEVQSSTRSKFSCSSSDVQLHQLGLGAGADRLSERKLRYLVDDTPQVLPTFGNVAQSFHMTKPPTVRFPGVDIELPKVLHASEAVSIPGPGGDPLHRDLGQRQGRGDLVRDHGDHTGRPALDAEAVDLRPRRGWVRRRAGPSTSTAPPDPAPDLELSLPTLPQQALLYRMCGDRCTRIPNSLRLRDFPG
jgi:hypothetical protein